MNWALAVVAGLSYLGAAYYAQASHKEVLAAVPILGFALTLPAVAHAVGLGGTREAIRAALPPALLIVGATQILSGGAALWPIGTFGLWALIELFRRRQVREAMVALVRRAVPAVAASI